MFSLAFFLHDLHFALCLVFCCSEFSQTRVRSVALIRVRLASPFHSGFDKCDVLPEAMSCSAVVVTGAVLRALGRIVSRLETPCLIFVFFGVFCGIQELGVLWGV